MADNNGQEKTEKATPRKLRKSREEGQVARSVEISNFAVFSAGMFALLVSRSFLGKQFYSFTQNIFENLNSFNIQLNLLQVYAVKWMLFFLGTTAPFFIGIIFFTLAANILQVGFKITPKALRPKFDKLNPLKGIKKVFFSAQSFVETIKSLLKFSIIGYLVYIFILDMTEETTTLATFSIIDILKFMSEGAKSLIVKLSLIYAVLAAADFVYQKYKFNKEMMMTKQEVKEEVKQTEGNPEIKGRIKSVQMEMARKRMMKELPTADVVITNPTHLAVAIKYDPLKNNAPVVIAKGADLLAQRIKEIAKENNIYIYEDKPLARLLYRSCEIGQEIPEALFEAVAKVLAFVYGLRKKRKKIV